MPPIDLRSDTVSHPSPAMRLAMSTAAVGDDGFGDDPTVKALEALAARRLGKEAALLVASGTMGNLVALLTHAERGNEVIVGDRSHILRSEVAGAAALGRIQLRPLANGPRGELDPAQARATVRAVDVHFPTTALICLENTHNACNGAALSRADMAPIAAVARAAGIAFHIDGARIFNAAVALGVDPADLVADADTVQFCLSKGLACPIGSLIVGSGEFIGRARRYRQMVGGAMRQAGIVAAAGIVALEEMVDRMAEDHANARRLAEGLASIPGVVCDPSVVETNIIFYSVSGPAASGFVERLRGRGVLVGVNRMVTHYGITAAHVADALEAIRAAVHEPALVPAT
ncbi:MAG: low-specificity L-threonine aldolase [Dehalococcoidia bacterium]